MIAPVGLSGKASDIRKIFYISYDGLLDPLGQSQILPIVTGIADSKTDVHLITFEKPERWAQTQERYLTAAQLTTHNISWIPLRYHKRLSLLATLWDLLRLGLVLLKFAIRGEIDLIHCRSYPPTLVALCFKKLFRIRYIFDMRALYCDERVDSGLWMASSISYRIAKFCERKMLVNAHKIVTLTEASIPVIQEIAHQDNTLSPIVIPTTVPLDKFVPRFEIGHDFPVLAYFGSYGGGYLIEEIIKFGLVFLKEIHNSKLLFLINNMNSHLITDTFDRLTGNSNLERNRVEVDSVPYVDIPNRLSGALATISFVNPTPSRVAMAPTKVSESLSLGMPVIVNAGIGDLVEIVNSSKVGIVSSPFSRNNWTTDVHSIYTLGTSKECRIRCRKVAETLFSADSAVNKYLELYNS